MLSREKYFARDTTSSKRKRSCAAKHDWRTCLPVRKDFNLLHKRRRYWGVSSLLNRKEGRKRRENTNKKGPWRFSRLELFGKAATKKQITIIQIHHNVELTIVKITKINGNMINAQVRSGETAQCNRLGQEDYSMIRMHTNFMCIYVLRKLKKICTSAKSKTPENTEKEDTLEKKFLKNRITAREIDIP